MGPSNPPATPGQTETSSPQPPPGSAPTGQPEQPPQSPKSTPTLRSGVPRPSAAKGLGRETQDETTAGGRWRTWWRRVWAPPDPDLVDAGLRGEWLIAGIRLLIVLLILYDPLARYINAPRESGREFILWVGVAALSEAFLVYVAVRRSWGRSWIGFFSGIVDISLVTASLLIFVRIGEPMTAVSDLLLFPLYLLAIGATSLRYDWRICLITGICALFEYLTVLAYVYYLWDLGPSFDLSLQGGRLILLAMATLLATTVVVRAREQRLLSTRDRLTDLANRGFFDDSLAQLEAIATRSGDPIGVVMIDVDHFKRFNDSYGHLAGDEALRRVAATLSHSFRNTDLIARYGGEEFAGLFPGMKIEDAIKRLDALRHTIETMPIDTGTSAGKVRVTVSMGVAVWPGDGVNLAETLSIADNRLYQAKTTGRNRVVGRAGQVLGGEPPGG